MGVPVLFFVVQPKGLEPLAFGSVDRRSIQLSYGCIILNFAVPIRLSLRFRSLLKRGKEIRVFGHRSRVVYALTHLALIKQCTTLF